MVHTILMGKLGQRGDQLAANGHSHENKLLLMKHSYHNHGVVFWGLHWRGGGGGGGVLCSRMVLCMVASHTTSSSDVLCSRMVLCMVASHTTSSSDVLCSRMVYMVASHTTSSSDVLWS